jgi:3-methyladenine DNA glycosylase AlkD
MIKQIKKDIQQKANPEKAVILARFFKTGKGEYGEGDIFIGVTIPNIRTIAKKYANIPLNTIQQLLNNPVHELRVTGVIILVNKFKKATEAEREKIYNFYIKNFKNINNWDLVDLSCHHIVGEFLLDKQEKRKILYEWAKSNDLWTKRIAVISTFDFIRNKQFDECLHIAELLLNDKHDLIHKAVGWMLRETGKRNQEVEEKFLRKHYKKMPRTMLRYSIEKFDKNKKAFYMKK